MSQNIKNNIKTLTEDQIPWLGAQQQMGVAANELEFSWALSVLELTMVMAAQP